MQFRAVDGAVVSVVAALCVGVALNAQQARRVTATPSWQLPRTIDGHPDLQGVWSFATITPLQRPQVFEGRAFVSGDEAAPFELQLLQNARRGNQQAIGELWFERGPLAQLDGRYPTSLIVEPADGRLPAMTLDTQRRLSAPPAGRRFDGPASFTLSERCLRSASGPPYLPGAPDANLIRIVQSRDHVAIVQEKFHETRIVVFGERPHLSSEIRRWVGDSRGRWEDDVLVIDTINFTPQLSLANRFDENLRLIERLERVAADVLIYEFTVDDATFFVRPWTARLPMIRTGEELYEFACHEGNYSLPNILRGARAEERNSR